MKVQEKIHKPDIVLIHFRYPYEFEGRHYDAAMSFDVRDGKTREEMAEIAREAARRLISKHTGANPKDIIFTP